MTDPIDWTKPVELMNGDTRIAYPEGNYVWVDSPNPNGYSGFNCDRQGRIGGVQVVRNRKEPVKHLYYVHWHDADMGVAVYRSSQAPISGREQFAKILVWRDADGKTRAEVCDD